MYHCLRHCHHINNARSKTISAVSVTYTGDPKPINGRLLCTRCAQNIHVCGDGVRSTQFGVLLFKYYNKYIIT